MKSSALQRRLFSHITIVFNKLKESLYKDFGNTCDCFVDSKLSFYLGDDKTK